MARHRKIKRHTYSYRTRKRRRRNLMRALTCLLILAALILIGYSVALSLERLSEPSAPSEESSQTETIPSETSKEPESSVPSSEPEPEPEPEDLAVRAVLMPHDIMMDAAGRADFLENIDKERYNTVVLPLKDQSGRIWYQTEVSHAAVCGALSENALDAKALLAEIEANDLDPAAMIWSLQDDWASHAMYHTSYMYQNDPDVTWLDNSADMGGKSWMNPYLPATQEYLCALTSELSTLGFEEIFVFGNQYPNTGNQWGMGLGSQNGLSQADALQNIIISMQDAAGETAVIPAYLGDCYTEGVRPQIYTVTPNSFTHTPTAPILGSDMAVLEKVTAEKETLIPVIDEELLTSVQNLGIEQYLVR